MDTSVAQVVDIINIADTVAQIEEIRDGSNDIIDNDVLGNQIVASASDLFLELLGIVGAFQYLLEYCEAYLLVDAALSRIKVNISLHIYHAAAYDLDFLVYHSGNGLACGSSLVLLYLNGNESFLNTRGLDLHSLLIADEVALFCQNFACHGSHDGSCDLMTY